MRLDKYLKVSRIIKRRTVAKEAGEGGRVTINGKVAKPSSEVKEGDILEIRFGDKLARYKVVTVAEVVRKNEASLMYEVLDGGELNL
ncbi:MAG: RNA-binding S4 domain-containing protein [Clostridia bacterium]|nr:RNA-binding S4 domain-containing protein [Clostridia bacterium]